VRRLAAALLAACLALAVCACAGGPAASAGLGNGWEPEGETPLQYATQFTVEHYQGGCRLLTLADGSRFFVVPEGEAVPEGIAADITVLQRPIGDVYLAGTAVMCLFDALDSLEAITLSGTKADGWYIENARAAMERGDILYAGKYSEPDYELILQKGCRLAVESTMILHTPDVKEKLLELGVPVLVDLSSQESHPLGRTEWIKFYGALLGREDEAAAFFNRQKQYLDETAASGDTGKTVAFFYISPAGYAVARRSGDYLTKMIELAGGRYIFTDLGDPETATSTVALEMERFYATAKDADVIIYNSTITGSQGMQSLEELLAKSELLRDFKAVQTGNVWCTNQNLYQEMTQLGTVIADLHTVLTEEDPDPSSLAFLYRLE